MIDCLIIGFNDTNFHEYVSMVKSMGQNSGAYRDLNLYYLNYQNEARHALDLLNHFHFEDQDGPHKPFHNSDFLWPVITYLGTYLHRRGLSFDYVNLFHPDENLKSKLQEEEILTIAITTTLYVSVQPILEIISFIRKYNKTAKIIVGGPFIVNQFKALQKPALSSLLKYIDSDFYVNSSEGEYTLAKLISTLKTGGDLADLANIAYKQNKGYIVTATQVESNPLEENIVNYSLFPREEFGEFVTLRTAKSCPFSCSFCGFPQRAGKYTYLSVEHVEHELNQIRDIGTVNTLTFIDDTFNVPKGRFKQILRMMIRNKYNFKWNSFYRSDHGDEETIALMRDAGCEGVFLGTESGSDEQLQRMNKTARQRHYKEAIPLFRDAGIVTHANLIIGFPGETRETVQETVDFIEEAQPDFFRAQLWYCDPMTPIWDRREEFGVQGRAFNWSHATMDAAMACDLIDQMFLSVTNSTWLPQNGFELWSVFYLQRKNMPLSQIKTYLSAFNAAVKEKLKNPANQEIRPDLLEAIRTSSKF